MSSIIGWEPQDLRKRAEECERLGRDNGLPVLWAMLAPASRGLALIREGRAAEGIVPLKASILAWEATGGRSRSPTRKAHLAEAMALTGDLDNALQLIDEAIAKSNALGGRNAFSMPRSFASRAGCSRSRATLKVPNGTFSPRSTGRAASRRNPGSCARRPASPGCGRARANARTRMTLLAPVYELVHRRFRHQGFAGREGTSRRTGVTPHYVRLIETKPADFPFFLWRVRLRHQWPPPDRTIRTNRRPSVGGNRCAAPAAVLEHLGCWRTANPVILLLGLQACSLVRRRAGHKLIQAQAVALREVQ